MIIDWKKYYTSSEAKDILNKSLIKDAKKLENDLKEIKSNKKELCIN